MSIRSARLDDLALMVAIERAAGETFRSLGMDLVADDDPGSVPALGPYADAGRAFVSVDADDRPLGYLLLDVVDGAAHVEQVTVHPDHARQGIGRALLDARGLGARPGLRALTLTTYVEVPWNGPYYERLGFRYLTPDEDTPGCGRSAATSARSASTHGRAPAWSAPSTEPGRGAPSEAVTASPQPGLHAVGHADRTEGAGQVGLDGLLADLEPACDLLVRQAVRDERQHLTLALGEGVQRVGLSRWAPSIVRAARGSSGDSPRAAV